VKGRVPDSGGEREKAADRGLAREVRYSLHMLRKNPIVLLGTIVALGSLLLAALSGLLVDPNSWKITNLDNRLCWNNSLIDWNVRNVFVCSGQAYPLGTDNYGRDVLRMIVLALPLDLQVSLEIVLSAVLIGVVGGGAAAYAGGKLDELILRVTDVFLAVPALLLAIVLATVLGRTLENLTLSVLVTWWPTYLRLMRSQVLTEKEKPYVEALRAVGAGRLRILFRHIIPNSIYPILVQGTLDIGSVILTFSALTFIGFSPSPLVPELGNLVNQGIQFVFTAPWLIIFPGLTIFVVSLGFNLLGDGVRDIFDPRLRR
jgi:peptide/nickel transport system permease protein